MKTTRCTTCYSEFTEQEIEGASACPTCGNKGVPCAISEDIDLRINWHELRILGIWASNYAVEKFKGDSSHRALKAILARIEAKHPEKPALSLSGEMKQIAKSGLCGDVELHRADGTVERIKSEKPS